MGASGHRFTAADWKINWEGQSKEDRTDFDIVFVNERYAETYKLQMNKGRFFNEEREGDRNNLVINESAATAMGLKNPIGTAVTRNGKQGEIIGVLKDFHLTNLKSTIAPAMFLCRSGDRLYHIRISPIDIPETIAFIQEQWKKFVPERQLKYDFLDESLASFYINDVKLSRLIRFYTMLSLLVACFGLFGLVALIMQERTKEIGVRKVLGATVVQINSLLWKEYVWLVAIANIIAWPVAYYIVSHWLQSYAYRISIGGELFIGSSVLVLVVALATVSYHTIKAATVNPVDSLRYE
jgi:putative ABC transport system permease protein